MELLGSHYFLVYPGFVPEEVEFKEFEKSIEYDQMLKDKHYALDPMWRSFSPEKRKKLRAFITSMPGVKNKKEHTTKVYIDSAKEWAISSFGFDVFEFLDSIEDSDNIIYHVAKAYGVWRVLDIQEKTYIIMELKELIKDMIPWNTIQNRFLRYYALLSDSPQWVQRIFQT